MMHTGRNSVDVPVEYAKAFAEPAERREVRFEWHFRNPFTRSELFDSAPQEHAAEMLAGLVTDS